MEALVLNMDNIMEIALTANYETTVQLMDSYPQLNTTDFWKNKCDKKYPGKLYIDKWSGKENYLVHSKNEFCVNVNFGDNHDVDYQLYEYDEMLDDILSSVAENIHYGAGDSNNTLVKVNINKGKYILIIDDIENLIQYIDTYQSQQEAMDVITQRRLSLSQDADDDDGFFNCMLFFKIFISS